MSFINDSILTFPDLASQIEFIVPCDSSYSARLIQQVIRGFRHRLKNQFQITFELPHGVCELDMNVYGIDDIERVEFSCGDGCWKNAITWRTQDNRLIFDGREVHGAVRITYWETPGYMPTGAVLGDSTQSLDTSTPSLRVTLPLNQGRPIVPTSGYIRIGSDQHAATWVEYRGLYFNRLTVGTHGSIYLTGVQEYPLQSDMDIPVYYAAGTPVEWGIAFRDEGTLDAFIKQSAAYYWATQTGQCKNDDDRSSAMQLMNFWSEEAEKAWRIVHSPRKPVVRRQRFPGG